MSKFKEWIEEAIASSPEQRNWRMIEPKIDTAIGHVATVANLVTKGSKQQKGLNSILNSLKAIKADIRHMS